MQRNSEAAPSRIRHLKKEDGEPLWRKDIQYDFLRHVFDDEKKVFSNSYEANETGKQSFAELYIDTMARSSKTSKVLRDKLLSDREAAKSMAMVCLLVNVGRMNTTLNFFPEMRAQLRTYHSIPSLQAYQDATAYKQLQDAPRLKSILKGAAEDRATEPRTLGEFKTMGVPRTNPVNLIFLICQQTINVAELHFPENLEFHDLIMATNFSSESRANAFLWIMWFYLESDFTEEGCDENPFGSGVDYGRGVANQGIPQLVELLQGEEEEENIDPQEEVDFGEEKRSHRARIIAAEQAYQDSQDKKRQSRGPKPLNDDLSAAILPRIRPSKHESDMDSTRSTPPPKALAGRLGAAASTGRRGIASLKYQIMEPSSPAAVPSVDGIVPRKPRPPTAHQLAVEQSRHKHVEHILDRGIRRAQHAARKRRRTEGYLIRTISRLKEMPDPLIDSDEDDTAGSSSSPFRNRGMAGLCQLKTEQDDFGEQASYYGNALRRTARRLDRWEKQSARLRRRAEAESGEEGSEAGPDEEEGREADVEEAEEGLDDLDKMVLGYDPDMEEV